MRHNYSFTKALSDATKRLRYATKDRDRTQIRLSSLNAEIPALQRTIDALRRQLHPDDVAPAGEVPVIPAELSQFIGPQDLRGMGSSFAPTESEQLDELPEIEGNPVVPE